MQDSLSFLLILGTQPIRKRFCHDIEVLEGSGGSRGNAVFLKQAGVRLDAHGLAGGIGNHADALAVGRHFGVGMHGLVDE